MGRVGPSLSAQENRVGQAPTQTQAVEPPLGQTPKEATGAGAADDRAYEQLARQYAYFDQINRTFELVARTVSPAVVHIVAEKTGRIDEKSRIRHYEETGSGVIVRGDRLKTLFVLTNNHVVEGTTAAKITIFLHDGRAIHPVQVWLDSKADIAVLSLNREDLPAARFGNSDNMNIGSWVLALGSPFGLTHSVSQGIISARGRHMDELQDVENQDFLQTDAAINPGNSGGPLVNMKGEVIGINNSIASNGGGNEGVGFSIPINLARWIMNQLITNNGRVTRGALGIDLRPEFRAEDAAALGLDRPHGAWVDVVHPSSPAAEGGLMDQDVILRFQGVEVNDLNHLINLVSMAPIGKTADLLIWRARTELTLKVMVGDRDRTIAQGVVSSHTGTESRSGLLRRPARPPGSTVAVMGMDLQTLDESVARQLGLPRTLHGAVITEIAPHSPLLNVLQRLDVIASINGRQITGASDALASLKVKTSSPPASTTTPLDISFDRVVKGEIVHRSVRVP
ncbi:MAG: DegQ family serine endoprotease [Isosphaeraceae bacterium]